MVAGVGVGWQPAEHGQASRLIGARLWLRWGCVGGVIALATVGLLLITRRLAGAISGDLPLPHLIATATIAGVFVFGGRIVWHRLALSRERRELQFETAFGSGGSAALALVALGCSLGRGWDWLVWLPLVGVEQWQLRWFLRGGGHEGTDSQIVGGRRGDASPELRESLGVEEIPPLAPPFEGGGVLVQQLLRVRDEDGVESVQGTLRAEFVAGQRQATLYIGFCPPLARSPAVEAECVEGPEAELKVAQAFCHGARLEVRLGEAAEEDCLVIVEMVAKPSASADL